MSPLLANLYLHWFDALFHGPQGPASWANAKLVRYADDCAPRAQRAEEGPMCVTGLRMGKAPRNPLAGAGSKSPPAAVVKSHGGERGRKRPGKLHPEKTKVVYCKDEDRLRRYPNEKFDFLGYGFQPWRSKNRFGKFFINFSPAISDKAGKSQSSLTSRRCLEIVAGHYR